MWPPGPRRNFLLRTPVGNNATLTSVTVQDAHGAALLAGVGAADGDDAAPIAVYHPAFLLLSAGAFQRLLAGDLFNIYEF